ncbi:MAG TPA: nuclear transport factor 2 family protein [Acidimicrobiales bacterium]|nr:nuclear transport factor 2 family protein [Acidimicrobiales bacterium]
MTDGASAVVERFWAALYDRDWPRIRSFFDADSIYYDVPTGPATAARGPEGIEARLRLGLEGLAGYEHQPGLLAVGADGVVLTEHTEVWHWRTGETVALPFVSVQRVRGDTIELWKDYWDYATLINGAPPWWVEEIMAADLPWLFDATGMA